MDKCSNRRIGNKLYAYEAGLLNDADREQFEIHLLECRYCNDRARSFSDEARLIRHDPKLHEVIADLADAAPAESRWRPGLLRSALALAAVVVFLLLKPWQLEFRPTQEAVAAEDRLAVMYFDNMVDPADSARLGEIVANLITTDISESRYIQVVSSQRIYDILKGLGRVDSGRADRSAAEEVAREANARWILTGCILSTDPTLSLSWQLVERAGGDVVASERIAGATGETVFDLVDRLTVQVRAGLGLAPVATDDRDRAVADVTTHSTLAYRHYLDGLGYYSRFYSEEAAASFLKAVEFDSTFAMAYYYLAFLVDREYAHRAIQYAPRASRREQMYIAGLKASYDRDLAGAEEHLLQLVGAYPDEKMAWYLLGRYAYARRGPEAITRLRKAIELDPLYKMPYSLLAYAYQENDEADSALWAINRYIELAPDEANPYDSRGEILAEHGHLDEAIASYEQAIAVKRDFGQYNSLSKLGELLVFKGEYDRARECFREIVQNGAKGARSRARTNLAQIPLYRGRIGDALRTLDDGIAADRLEQATSGLQGDRASKRMAKALAYLELNDLESAVAEIRLAVEIHGRAYPEDRYAYRYILAQILADAGDFGQAEAIADEMRQYLETMGRELSGYYYARGCIQLARDSVSQAIASLEEASKANDTFYAGYMLAQAYLRAGRPEEAAAELERHLAGYQTFRFIFALWSARSYYSLGLAYEGMGEPDRAVEAYKTLLTVWSEADPDLAAAADARSRLNRLQARP